MSHFILCATQTILLTLSSNFEFSFVSDVYFKHRSDKSDKKVTKFKQYQIYFDVFLKIILVVKPVKLFEQ